MSLQCSWENPNISIKGPSAPRITHSRVGWLRSSSFSRKARLIFADFFMSLVCFAAIGFIFAICSLLDITPGDRLRQGYGKETQFCPARNGISCPAGKSDFIDLAEWMRSLRVGSGA